VDEQPWARLKTIIKTWLENKVLKVIRDKDEKRRDRDFIVPGSSYGAHDNGGGDDEVALQ
jgi:hypothetical protein